MIQFKDMELNGIVFGKYTVDLFELEGALGITVHKGKNDDGTEKTVDIVIHRNSVVIS